MWEDQNPDPGGTNVGPAEAQELSDLKDQNEQQLVLIAQLKEMLRKEQSTVSQDKVEEYVNTLNRARAKRFRQRKGEPDASSSTSTGTVNIDVIKKERVNLLRQQLEENKAKLAQRGRSQKGIEEMVSQMQAQLKDSQAQISPSSLNSSVVGVKTLDYNENTPQKELYNILMIKERKITELLNKSHKLEGTLVDLQDNLKEKDSVIDARTKAITLMTDSLSKKGKDTLDALEETKEQMRRMQENFVTLEAEMKARQLTLLNDLKLKNFEISELQEANAKLEREKQELREFSERTSPINVSETKDMVELLQAEINSLKLENERLLRNSGNFADSVNVEELRNSLKEVTDQNTAHLLKISQLETIIQKTTVISDNDDVLQLSAKINDLQSELGETVAKLNSKCVENGQIVETNRRLTCENSEYLARIESLGKELEKIAKKVSSQEEATKSAEGESEEIAKLKKQLDESNKNMIKMRATQKSKIKELNKKLDQFRKMNDSNALIAQLQTDISKLQEKITELEDEKGNLQLKMVDLATSSKEDQSALEEELAQLKDKFEKAEQQLDEKDKVIQILEEEVLSLKTDLKRKLEEEVKVSSQVSSEMSSIYFEEQIEKLESEKKRLNEQIDYLNSEKEIILQDLEAVRKEKQELNGRLELYIQENMELIDKLEKLSAEKVSSAESIEIVEGLTQQEKLELAAYQQHLNPEDDDGIEPPAELNETVLQLNEDTAELLQKIDMFTQERKEVMQKMENLKEENCALSVKIQEIENNRDILEETYEQLQNEKEQLELEKQGLSEKLAQLDKGKPEVMIDESADNTLASDLTQLQTEYETLIQENDRLKRTLKNFDLVIQEKYDLETKLREVLENNTNLDTKLNSDLDEINNYQLIIEENKAELIKSSETINKLQSQLEERESDIQELHININELNSVISELQNKEGNFEGFESQLNELKSTLQLQIEQAAEYETEISQNVEIIRGLKEELLGVNRRALELENQLELKDGELEKLTKEVSNKDAIIRSLQADIEEKDQSFKTVTEDIKKKYLHLQEQLNNNEGSVQRQVTELTNRNKEQLEKMKRIAGALKKKTQAYQDLEDQYNRDKEKWEHEEQEKSGVIATLKQKSNMQEDALRSLGEQVEHLQQINADQQHYIQDLKHKQEKLLETNLQQEMSASLHEEVDTSMSRSIIDDKVRALELLVETNENDITHYKGRIERLEEDLRQLQDAKNQLEIANSELNEKLDLTSNSFKEKALLQDQLELRLSEVTANDDSLLKRLQDIQEEHAAAVKRNREHEELIKKLKIKLKKSHDKVTELKASQDKLQDLEVATQEFKKQVSTLEDKLRHAQGENDALQRRTVSDYEKIEADYQVQMEELLKSRNELFINNEKLLERVKELEDREQELGLELVDVRRNLEEANKKRTEEVSVLMEDLQAARANSNEAHASVQESLLKITELTHELDLTKKNFVVLERQLEELVVDKKQLVASLEEAHAQLDRVTDESMKVRLELERTSEEAHEAQRKVNEVILESEQLRQQINGLEFAKASLEASCESSQKLQEYPSPGELAQSAYGLSLSVSTSAGGNAADLSSDLISPRSQLETTLREVHLLREQVSKLQRDNHALQFANSSLEASYESSQKPEPIGDVLNVENQPVAEQQIPLFDAFAQAPSNSAFDSIRREDLLEQRTVTNLHTQAPSDQRPPNLNLERPNVQFESGQQLIIENGREALLQKIKALEFLLYNVDKEKEVALDQCTEIVVSLSEMFCNRQAKPQSEMESQIMSQQAVAALAVDKQALEATEYAPINKDFGPHATPVSEEVIQPKEAYICFDNDETPLAPTQPLSPLESQVMSQAALSDLASNKQALEALEYQPVDGSKGQQQQAVVEPPAHSKHAYLCYTKDDKPQSLEAFEENDDGWAWGPEEARLEAEHINTLENIPQVKSLLLEVQQLKETIRVLQMERENHLEEIKQLQVKSGKLIKKCKELKTKHDGHSSKKPADEGSFFDLNETIQDELKAQVKQLEKRLKEVSVENEKEKAERSNLLKRVDVLTAANDRLTEMKEIQDAEVHRLQRKCEDAAEKLKEFQWGNGAFGSQKLPSTSAITDYRNDDFGSDKLQESSDQSSSKIKELEETIRDISLDNEELQTLLAEQTAKRLEAERHKSSGNEEELKELRSMNEQLHKNLEEVKLQTGALEVEKETLIEEKLRLEKSLRDTEAAVIELERHVTSSKIDLEEKEGFDNLGIQQEQQINDLQFKLELITKDKIHLENLLTQYQEELRVKTEESENLLGQLKAGNFQTNFDKSILSTQNEHLHQVLHEKNQTIDNLNSTIEDIIGKKSTTESELLQAQSKLRSVESEFEQQHTTIMQDLLSKIAQIQQSQELINELQTRVNELENIASEKAKLEKENQFLAAKLQQQLEELGYKNRDLELINESLGQSTQEIEQLQAEKTARDLEIEKLLSDIQNKEQEFQDRINLIVNELNENWQVQVDQRGADVAESWKLHLEIVEKDYGAAQDKIRVDIQELEEKCNILVNENNELRKNVDQEIRNEVDKMSALHQQISSLQQTVSTLKETIEEKDRRIEEIQNNLTNYLSLEQELQALRADNDEKEKKLSSINVVIETTQKQFDEKREVVEEIVSLLEKRALSPLSYEKLDILQEFQRQLTLNSGREGEVLKLTQAVQELEDKLTRLTGEKNREITGLNQVIDDLNKELSVVHEKEAEIVRLGTELKDLQEQIILVQQEKEFIAVEFDKFKLDHSNCLLTIGDCNRRIQEFEIVQQSLQQNMYEKDEEIAKLRREIEHSESKNDSNKEVEALSTALARLNEEYQEMQNSLSETQNELGRVKEDLSQRDQDLQSANSNITQLQQAHDYYKQESNRLKELLDQREMEYHKSLEMLKNSQLSDLQRHYDELLSNKDVDIDTLRGQIQELINSNQSFAERLNQEMAVRQQIEQQLNERTQLIEEDTKQLEELKLIIEDQVAKIDQLKKELFNKSNQYDSLIAEMDVGRAPVTRQPVAGAPAEIQKSPYSEEDLTEPVSRAELDIALYMLHQRDVRCEELTVELTQLLEERDTLQLRLSNAIREKEELKRSLEGNTSTTMSGIPEADFRQIQSSTTHLLHTSGSELAKDPLENEKNLATKLSELKNIGYKRDKTFVDEQDARRLQQLAIMQQHINEASRLPPEAAAKLVDATYTLSRDVQSPSKVLLNWLWGKNPPKANDS